MASELSSLFITFANSPGHLVYHLILSLGLLFCMFWASSKVNQPDKKKTARFLLIGSGILFTIQIVLLLITLFNSAEIFQTSLTFAVVERLCVGLTIIWLVWMLQDDKKQMLLNGILIFLSIVLILINTAAILLINWLPDAFANSFQVFDIIWQSATLLMILFGLAFILIQKPQQWSMGLVILVILSLGQVFQIIFASIGDLHMGAVRFAQILSMPFLINFLIQRLNHTEKIAKQRIQKGKAQDIPLDTKPNLMNLLLAIPLDSTPQGRIEAVARAISLGVVADICYILRINDPRDSLEILSGYDLIQEKFLPKSTLAFTDLPQIIAAWEENRVLQRSQAQLDDRDYETLIKCLNYFRTGNVLAIPLSSADEPLSGGLIFLSPYTSKQWDQKTLDLIETIKHNLTHVLFFPTPLEKLKEKLENVQGEKQQLTSEKGTLSRFLANKELALDQQEKYIQQLTNKLDTINTDADQRIETLQLQIEKLKAALSSQQSGPNLEQIQSEIRQLTNENEQLQIMLSRANARIRDLETQAGQTGPIRLSMQNQIISLDSIAANVKLQINQQLQQKHLNLEIINPDGRQMIKTDPELLQNILLGLLENAIQVSQAGNAIQLSQRLSFETGMLIIEVTDFGEGLTPEEQKAFFSADYNAMPGIGSISAIRNAIRAIRVLNGKIWLRSKKWNFTTFRVQLPVRIID